MTSNRPLAPCSFIVIGMVVLTIGAGVWFLFGDSIRERLSRQRFDSVVWKAHEPSLSNPVRIRMVDDLLRRHRFHGMTHDEVTDLIGEPDKTAYFNDWDMVYWLGPERGFFGFDSEWLVIRLDEQRTVTEYEIATD